MWCPECPLCAYLCSKHMLVERTVSDSMLKCATWMHSDRHECGLPTFPVAESRMTYLYSKVLLVLQAEQAYCVACHTSMLVCIPNATPPSADGLIML
jgi:hypothetical protein